MVSVSQERDSGNSDQINQIVINCFPTAKYIPEIRCIAGGLNERIYYASSELVSLVEIERIRKEIKNSGLIFKIYTLNEMISRLIEARVDHYGKDSYGKERDPIIKFDDDWAFLKNYQRKPKIGEVVIATLQPRIEGVKHQFADFVEFKK